MGVDFTIITAGLALGFAHAFEADHLAAVTTMSADPLRDRAGAPRYAAVLWAAGHAVGLFVLGVAAILLSSAVPLNLAAWAERLVGPLLILLGVRTMIRSGVFHRHAHRHGAARHEHYHVHLGARDHHHGPAGGRAGGAHTPLLVGALHGVAGTGGAVIVAASAGFAGAAQGVAFLAIFGVGTVAAMTLYSGAFSLTARLVRRRETLAQGAMLACGCVSAAVGAYLLVGTLAGAS